MNIRQSNVKGDEMASKYTGKTSDLICQFDLKNHKWRCRDTSEIGSWHTRDVRLKRGKRRPYVPTLLRSFGDVVMDIRAGSCSKEGDTLICEVPKRR